MYKRLALVFSLVIIMVCGVMSPVLADDKPKKHYKGEKIALESGDEAVCIGYDTHGNPIWQATLGDPIYVRGTNTPYDIAWYLDEKGDFIAGDNDFEVEVKEKKVTVTYQGKSLDWNPDVTLTTQGNKVKLKEKLTTAVVLPYDPININYLSNTLMWDYDSGVKRYLRIIEGMLIEYYVIEEPLDGDIEFKHNSTKDEEFIWSRSPEAYDSENKAISIDVLEDTIKLKKDKLANATYPIVIDPDTTVYTSSSDGYVYRNGGSGVAYATVWGADDGDTVINTWTRLVIGQRYIGGLNDSFTIDKTGVFFDTSILADNATISAATLGLYGVVDNSDTNFEITIQTGNVTAPHDPMVIGDYDKDDYSGDGGGLSTATFITTGYNDITLEAAGIGWIDDTGTTKFILRSNRDIAGTAPSGQESVTVYSYEMGSGYRPRLVVTYTVEAPEILINDASNIARTSARLNATVLDDGYEACQVRWGYGESSEAVVADYDTVTAWSDAEWTEGEHPYLDATGLSSDTTHYFRIEIKNSDSTVASGEESFDTLAVLNPPTNFRAFPSQTSIKLSWVRGLGASQTMIRYSPDTYPSDNVDGTLCFEGVLSVYELTDLTAGQTYYFSSWGESSGNYSTSYATVAATTIAYSVADSAGMDTPTMFDDWFASPDYTGLSNLEPIYSAINGVSDSFGTPRNTVWFGIVMLLIVVIAVGVMAKWGFEAGLIIGIMVEVGAWGIGMLPIWMIFGTVIFGIAVWLINASGLRSE